MEVRKALIPAAGLGSRMFPYTKYINKLMLPIVNKPVIHFLVEELANSGIKEIIISGRNLYDIKHYFRSSKKLTSLTTKFGHEGTLEKLNHITKKCRIRYLEQENPRGWMYEVYKAKRFLKDGPFAVVFSDIIYDCKIPALKQIILKHKKTKLHIHANGRYIFKPSLFKILNKESFFIGDDSKVVIDVFSKLSSKGDFLHMPIKGKAFDTGEPLSYIKTINHFALKNKEISEEYKAHLKEIVPKIIENEKKIQ